MPFILEGIVTTQDPRGAVHLAPMGPIVEGDFSQLVLRPFQTSTTFAHLQAHGEGVFHLSDDVELLARAAIGRVDPLPALRPATAVRGHVIEEACRWFAFRVTKSDTSAPRAVLTAEVVDSGKHRDFLGFNRARHAVVEAAILATRVHLMTPDDLLAEMARWRTLVDKTGGESEHRAFDLLLAYVNEAILAGSWGLGRE